MHDERYHRLFEAGRAPGGYVDLTAGTADGANAANAAQTGAAGTPGSNAVNGYVAPAVDFTDIAGAPEAASDDTVDSVRAAAAGVSPAPQSAPQAAPSLSATMPATTPSPTTPGADADDKAGDDSRVLKSPFPLPDLRDDDVDDDMDQSREEFTTVYDIIDRLESALNEAKGSIFSPGQVRIDRDDFSDNLNELKKMLPVQLERASALMREAERRLEGAQTQANAIVASAQSRAADIVKEANEQAQFLAGQENVTELARQKARTILNTAQAKADHLTHGADEYSTKVMETLRAQLNKMGGDVDAGLNVLYERRKAAAQDLPHLDINDYPEAQ
ncbi:cell division protein [Bifidobacterium callitrichos DSM 23973]|uniref:Cell division protein n=1 Tax=Bifidobacterium callitrichos DSM 23973 TaxID=1437609 RepID=A0A087A762_9BIFI|nr:cell division protein [Bifidobacterium callitrichos]KFI54612.1 cell division protein [Bifidobacterium callitrichos DSM 23973]